MEEQCKKTLDKALEIYNKEMNAIVGNVEIKNATELKNKQKQLENGLKEYMQKELKNYANLDENIKTLMVNCF